jgi:hypothetical protein
MKQFESGMLSTNAAVVSPSYQDARTLKTQRRSRVGAKEKSLAEMQRQETPIISGTEKQKRENIKFGQ